MATCDDKSQEGRRFEKEETTGVSKREKYAEPPGHTAESFQWGPSRDESIDGERERKKPIRSGT